ncbi:MAG: EamA family transporter [Phycisphaerales bacterium JB063]
MQWVGIILGLLSALGASLAYLCSRQYAVRAQRDEPDAAPWRPPLRLLVTAHVWLGGACTAALPVMLLVTRPTLDRPAFAVMMSAGVALFYLVGNVFLFLSLQRTDASRVAPLLGMKVILLALTVELFMGEDFTAAQWVAVVMATGAAVMLGTTGGKLPLKTLAMIFLTCAGFVLSDLFIKQMIPSWLPTGVSLDRADKTQRITAAVTGMAVAYVWCGGVALAMLPVVLQGHREGFARGLKASLPGGLPYAAAWFLSMVCLFSCFSLVGIVFGGILQSTRGLMSIALGFALAHLGHHHLEQHAPWPVVIRRLIAAAVMTAAIAIYTYEAAKG